MSMESVINSSDTVYFAVTDDFDIISLREVSRTLENEGDDFYVIETELLGSARHKKRFELKHESRFKTLFLIQDAECPEGNVFVSLNAAKESVYRSISGSISLKQSEINALTKKLIELELPCKKP